MMNPMKRGVVGMQLRGFAIFLQVTSFDSGNQYPSNTIAAEARPHLAESRQCAL